MYRMRRLSFILAVLLLVGLVVSREPVYATTIIVDGVNTGGEWDPVTLSGTLTGSFTSFRYTHNANVLFLRFDIGTYTSGTTFNIALDTVAGGTTGGSYGIGTDYRLAITGSAPGSISAFSCPFNPCANAISPSTLAVNINMGTGIIEVAVNFAAIGITTPGHNSPFTMRVYVAGGSTYDTQFNNLALPAPTDVDLVRFEAERQGDLVALTWETAAERDIVGFNLLRSATGSLAEAVVINEKIIEGKGNALAGDVYSFPDPGPVAGASYWLQVVKADSTTSEYGPVKPAAVLASTHQVFIPLVRR